MQIKTDREGAEAIRQLCDVALKSGGLRNLAPITQVLACLDHPDKPKPQQSPSPEPSPVPVTKKVAKKLKKAKKRGR